MKMIKKKHKFFGEKHKNMLRNVEYLLCTQSTDP